jgi:uncharacterized protein YdaU (DUF1376 family)
MKWYKRDPNAYFGGTRMLTPEQRGIYNDIIELLYMRDGILPDDDRRNARACMIAPQTWRRIKTDLIKLGKIQITDQHIMANRVQYCLEAAHKLGVSMSVLSQKRWKNNGDNMRDSNPPPKQGSLEVGFEGKPQQNQTGSVSQSRIQKDRSYFASLEEGEKRKKKSKTRAVKKLKKSARSLATAPDEGALTRSPSVTASPELAKVVQAKGWVK